MDTVAVEHLAPSGKPESAENVLIVEQDSGGSWVVRDSLGLKGGFFRSFSSAVHFAKDEARVTRIPIIVRETAGDPSLLGKTDEGARR